MENGCACLYNVILIDWERGKKYSRLLCLIFSFILCSFVVIALQ